MKRHTVGVALLCAFSVFVAVDATFAGVRLLGGYPGPSSEELGAISISLESDEPIVAFSGISIDGLVHQAFPPYVAATSVFLDDFFFPFSDIMEVDTHLLINRSSFAEISGSPIVETIEQSTEPYGWETGFGSFGQESDGIMTLLPEYQTTSMDFIHIVSPVGKCGFPVSILRVTVHTTSQKYQVHLDLPWTMNGTCGYYIASPDSDFGNVRVGTTATRNVENGNAGCCSCHWWTSAPGYPGYGDYTDLSFPEVDAPFGLDSVDYFRSACYSFSPQIRGQADIAADCLDHGQPDPNAGHLTFTGRGVGPVFEADQTPGTTLEFGNLQTDSFFDVFTEIGNLTDDPELGDLTSLTACAAIEGDATGAFQLIAGDLLELLVGQTDQIHLRFDAAGLAPGEYEAELVIQTDIGAAAGATGQGEVYSFPLHAIVVPEPSTMAGLLGLVAMGLLFIRCR